MKRTSLRLEGPILPGTIHAAYQEGITHYLLDFRPRSLNFIQLYKVQEILQQFKNHFVSFYLLFENEKDFVIGKILEDLVPLVANCELYLEFWGDEDALFAAQFSRAYIKRIGIKDRSEAFLQDSLCRGFYFNSHEEVMRWMRQKSFFNGQMFVRLSDFDLENNLSLDHSFFWSYPIEAHFEGGQRFIDFFQVKKVIHHVDRS